MVVRTRDFGCADALPAASWSSAVTCADRDSDSSVPLLPIPSLCRALALVCCRRCRSCSSFGIGLLNHSVELFADWRNFAVLAVGDRLCSKVAGEPAVATLGDHGHGDRLWGDVGISLANWALGGGSVFFGVRMPIWYFPNLFLAAFAAIVATDFWLEQNERTARPAYSRALGGAAISSTLVVALSYRRSVWLLLVAGMSLVAWRALRARHLSPRKWLTISLSGSLLAAILLLSVGTEALSERISSINPTSDNRLASTNSDHLGDLADAWDVVAESPVVGIGAGAYYETNRIVGWKVRSFEVHNAFLNAWLKFGLLGLVVYIGFHIRWIAALFRAGRAGLVGGAGAGIYLLADQVPALIQTWAYGSFQVSIQRGVLLAALLVSVVDTARIARPETTQRRNPGSSPSNDPTTRAGTACSSGRTTSACDRWPCRTGDAGISVVGATVS